MAENMMDRDAAVPRYSASADALERSRSTHALMVAFHFPPLVGSSGILRTLKFSQYLPEFGWQPIVLTAHPRAYPERANGHAVGGGTIVHRAFALDTRRHLSMRGAYPQSLALPDRWASWWLGAVPAGLRLIRKYRPEVIWSTYPVATAHLIGLTLHRLTGLPWVADFRDPMAQDGYPSDPLEWRVYKWLEYQALRHSAQSVFTTPGALRSYSQTYRDVPAARLELIPNGYDEEDFASLNSTRAPPNGGPIVLLHSGTLYPSERDPRQLFAALSQLLRTGKLRRELKIVLRATGHDAYVRKLLTEFRIEQMVSIEPPIPYREALAEMIDADGLLILQASNCNEQIPAKLYEYLRARRPLLALTDPNGDSAGALKEAGIDTIAPLDSTEAIIEALPRFLDLVALGQAPVAAPEHIAKSSRRFRTQQLAALFDRLTIR
jgi:glycosyltransferase involved in cell wall biosynthesis